MCFTDRSHVSAHCDEMSCYHSKYSTLLTSYFRKAFQFSQVILLFKNKQKIKFTILKSKKIDIILIRWYDALFVFNPFYNLSVHLPVHGLTTSSHIHIVTSQCLRRCLRLRFQNRYCVFKKHVSTCFSKLRFLSNKT